MPRRSKRTAMWGQWHERAAPVVSPFPSAPSPVRYPSRQGIFEPVCSPTFVGHSIHLSDYGAFVLTIGNAELFRFGARLTASQTMPAEGPRCLTFPAAPSSVEPKPEPLLASWFDRFFETEVNRTRNQLAEEVLRFNKAARESHAQRLDSWTRGKTEFDQACAQARAAFNEARQAWSTEFDRDSRLLTDFTEAYRRGDGKGVSAYLSTCLNAVPLPHWCPHEHELSFQSSSRTLLIEMRMPYLNGLAVVKARSDKIVPATKAEAAGIRRSFSYLVPLRLMWEAAQVDAERHIDTVGCNVRVVFDDPATGRSRCDTIMSIVAPAQQVREISLERVEPEACFRSLKGIAAADVLELVPIQPLIQFDKTDRRFVDARDILDGVGSTNLATMDWQDFEHLVRELFEKEFGADVRITQASRDKGVDAVAFDPDPIKGGKYVIQAKRYTNTVDVSAVRDLFGTLMAEGGNRGILVTTSNYGRDAYEFAKGKPITLLNGANLLHLLEKHGYVCRINMDE